MRDGFGVEGGSLMVVMVFVDSFGDRARETPHPAPSPHAAPSGPTLPSWRPCRVAASFLLWDKGEYTAPRPSTPFPPRSVGWRGRLVPRLFLALTVLPDSYLCRQPSTLVRCRVFPCIAWVSPQQTLSFQGLWWAEGWRDTRG